MALKKRIYDEQKPIDLASAMVKQIAEIKNKLDEIENKAKDEIKKIKEKSEKLARPLVEQIDSLFSGLYAHCKKNHEALFGEKKSFQTPYGSVQQKKNRPSVVILDEEEAIAELEEHGLGRFVRISEIKEIDKNAIISDPEAVSSLQFLKIKQDETFAVKPPKMKIIARAVDLLKKTVSN